VPLPQHAPADSQSTQPLPAQPQPWQQQQWQQQWQQQQQEQHPGAAWQQQQQQEQGEQDTGAAVPEAEASFDFLVPRPGSRASASTVDCRGGGGEGAECAWHTQGQQVSSIREELEGDQQQQQQQQQQVLHCDQQHSCSQQSQQDVTQQEQCQPMPDVSHQDVSPGKQQQMLARLCAKHGLPLPHPRNLSRQQKQQQAKGGSLWDPGSKQQQQLGGKVTQRGGAVARRREELLQQLRHNSIARQRSKQGVHATPEAPGATEQQPESAADLPAGSIGPSIAAAGAELLPDSSSHQQQQLLQLTWAGGSAPAARPLTPPSPAASDLHLVDGLQYVHALLGSIKMPSLSAGAAAATAPGEGGSSMQLWLPQPQQQQERSSRTGHGASGQEQQLLLRGVGAGQLHDLCSSALAKLRRASGSSCAAASAAAAAAGAQQSSSSSHHRADLPLQDALVLLCLTDSQQQQRVQQQECFAALNAAAQQHLRAPPGDVRHQQLQPGWHKQQRQQLSQGLCFGARQLGIRAVGQVAREQQGWMLQELQPLMRCLRQVGS
jgi:hypothetical protein